MYIFDKNFMFGVVRAIWNDATFLAVLARALQLFFCFSPCVGYRDGACRKESSG